MKSTIFFEPFHDIVWLSYIFSLLILILGGGILYTIMLRINYKRLKSYVGLSQCALNGTVEQHFNQLSGIYCTFRKLMESGQHPSLSEWNELDDSLHRIYPQFREILLSQHHLTDMEYKISMLVKADFLPKEIAILLCRSREAVSSIRRRLSKRVLNEKQPTPKHWDNYIMSL